MNTLTRLMQFHRYEEVASRHGLLLDGAPGVDAPRLPLSGLTKVHDAGRRLTVARAQAIASECGLTSDETAIFLPLRLDGDEPFEVAEDRFIAFLNRLYEGDSPTFLIPPAAGLDIPESGALPESSAFLERFYGGDFLPREKKPIVVDLRLCRGSFLRSIDHDAIQIIDAASQIASLPAGFRPGPVQSALDEGHFDAALIDAADRRDEGADYARELLKFAPPELKHVSFTSGGSEANEKALDLARRHGQGGCRVIAFEGSFHGRTLIPLFSTWSPQKRARYQIKGYETEFVVYPAGDDPYANPIVPVGWREHWAMPSLDRGRFLGDGDPLLELEVHSLLAVEAQLEKGDCAAVLIEPYQCEGGDRAATRRFYHGLRLLTRAWNVPLILDEVQTGFGLSGAFFWHRNFWFIDEQGRPDSPDLVTCAKRAQVGVVLSRWPDARPAVAHSASIARGRVHLELVWPPVLLEETVTRKLDELVELWPDLVSRPRTFGDAFAFDLPSPAIVKHLIAQRFYQGYMVYPAGELTLRFRLNRASTAADVELIFDIIDRSLGALVAQGGGQGDGLVARLNACIAPAWVASAHGPRRVRVPTLEALLANPRPETADQVLRVHGELCAAEREAGVAFLRLSDRAAGDRARADRPMGLAAVPALRSADAAAFEAAVGVPLLRFAADVLGTRIRLLTPAGFDELIESILALETDAYEAARRDEITYLRTVAGSDGGLVLVAEDSRGLVGMSFAGPLELWWAIDGPRQDENLGRDNTLYSADVTVARRARGRGIGLRLRQRQVHEALARRRPDGEPRYAFITGRNRVESADAMWALNQHMGAYCAAVYDGQYGEHAGRTRYYRIALRRHDRRAFAGPQLLADGGDDSLDLRSGIASPTGAEHPLLRRARALGTFDEASLTKLTVSNFITPAYARYAEYLRHCAPQGMKHLYLASGNDETVDKSLRALRHNRASGSMALSFRGGYAGHTTAASRSLTDASLGGAASGGPFAWFDWPILPHPDDDLTELEALIARTGADNILGMYIEAVQQRTGRVLSPEAWAGLVSLRDRTGVPLVLLENATGLHRTGRARWYADTLAGEADLLLFWAGGQMGHVYTNDRCYVAEPLTLISTWDGDELSATRLLWQYYAIEGHDVAAGVSALEAALARAHVPTTGLGLYRVLTADEEKVNLLDELLLKHGVRLGRTPLDTPGTRLIAPPITSSPAKLSRLATILGRAWAST